MNCSFRSRSEQAWRAAWPALGAAAAHNGGNEALFVNAARLKRDRLAAVELGWWVCPTDYERRQPNPFDYASHFPDFARTICREWIPMAIAETATGFWHMMLGIRPTP
jgi:hypothetical protein